MLHATPSAGSRATTSARCATRRRSASSATARWQEGLLPPRGARCRASTTSCGDSTSRWSVQAPRAAPTAARAFAIPTALSSRDAKLARARPRSRSATGSSREGYTCGACTGTSTTLPRRLRLRHRDVSAWAGIHYFASRDARAQNADPRRCSRGPKATAGSCGASPSATRRSRRAMRSCTGSRSAGATWRCTSISRARIARSRSPPSTSCGPRRSRSPRARSWRARVAWLMRSAPSTTRRGSPRISRSTSVRATGTGRRSPGTTSCTTAPRSATSSPPTRASPRTAARPCSPGTCRCAASRRGRRAKRLLATPREAWAERILGELSRPHPEIRTTVRRIDVFANGHAMVRPRPGFVWGDARRRVEAHAGRVHFAHSDASGLSLFEEAQYRGVAAAERVLARLGVRSESFL